LKKGRKEVLLEKEVASIFYGGLDGVIGDGTSGVIRVRG